MTNKTMLSVEVRALLQRVAAHDFAEDCQECGIGQSEAWKELRAFLDKEVDEFSPVGWSIDHSAGRPILMHNKCSVIEAEQAYGLLALIESSGQHQGEPVAVCRLWNEGGSGERTSVEFINEPCPDGTLLYAEQAAPFSPDTVVCRRYTLEQSPGQNFYHYDLKPVYGSVPVTISDLIDKAEAKPVAVVPQLDMAMVMMSLGMVRGAPVLTSNQCHALAQMLNKCLSEVARLNGVNP